MEWKCGPVVSACLALELHPQVWLPCNKADLWALKFEIHVIVMEYYFYFIACKNHFESVHGTKTRFDPRYGLPVSVLGRYSTT
jgi:hypothetical protein